MANQVPRLMNLVLRTWIVYCLLSSVCASDPTRPTISPVCIHQLSGPRGTITTPNFPKLYPVGVSCQWEIQANSSEGIQLSFSVFNLPLNNVGVTTNKLIVFSTDPASGSAPIMVFSGTKEQGYTYSFNSSVIWLTFQAGQNFTVIPKEIIIGFSIDYNTYSLLISCKDPGIPVHGSKPGGSFFLGSTVSYSCNTGYHLEGSKTTTCIANDSVPIWSSELPICVPSCVLPQVPVNGNMSGTIVTINANISFSCIIPFVLQGKQVLTCTTTHNGGGAWDGRVPTCNIPDCSKPVTFTRSPGALVNPSFHTGPLITNTTCTWTIIAESKQVIRFTSDYFALPADDDRSFVRFTDIVNATREFLYKAVGTPTPDLDITSKTNKVEVFYQGPTTSFNNVEGFYIDYIFIDAAKLITTTSITTTSSTQTTPVTTVATTPIASTSTVFSSTLISGITSVIVEINGTTEFLGVVDNESNKASNIAIGITIPLFLLFMIAGFIFYKWYRRKYPVRMIIGRDFGKFENPDYQNRLSTLTLVRDDADDFFKEATSKNTSSVCLNTHSGHDNLAFVQDTKNYNPGDDGDLVKRKSFLFKALEEHHDWMETEFVSSTSSQTSAFDSQETQETTESDKNSVASNNNTKSAKEQNNVQLSQEELHNIKNAKEFFQKETPIDIMSDTVRRKRALTVDETHDCRFTFGNAISARFRSKSLDLVHTVPKSNKQLSKENIAMLQNSVPNDSSSLLSKQIDTAQEFIRGSSDISQTIADDVRNTCEIDSEIVDTNLHANTHSKELAINVDEMKRSSSSEDSENMDGLLFTNAEFSDNESIPDIPMIYKNHSDSVTSLRGESDSNISNNSVRSSIADSENQVISPEASFVVLPTTETSDESGDVNNSTYSEKSASYSPEQEHKVSDTSDPENEAHNSTGVTTIPSTSSGSSTKSETELSNRSITYDVTRKKKKKSLFIPNECTSEAKYSDESDTSDNDSDTGVYSQKHKPTGHALNSDEHNDLQGYNKHDIDSSHSNIEFGSSNEEIHFSPSESVRSPSDHVQDGPVKSVGPDISFSADSTSFHSTTISSIASYSSDEEGEYVINPESFSVCSSSIDPIEMTTSNAISRPKAFHIMSNDSSLVSDLVMSPSAGEPKQKPQDNVESYSDKVACKLNVSDDEGDEMLTDADILKALKDDESDDQTEFQPLATSETIKPRNISIDNTFHFNDDDVDV